MIYKYEEPALYIGPAMNIAYVCEGQVRKHKSNGHCYVYFPLPGKIVIDGKVVPDPLTSEYKWLRLDVTKMAPAEIRKRIESKDPSLIIEPGDTLNVLSKPLINEELEVAASKYYNVR